jgi:hypothetical protein
MSIATKTKTETVFALAADKAKELGMRRKNDMTTLRFGQQVMLTTANGITLGTIRSTHGREDTYRYDIYSMDETKLCSYTFNRVPGSTDIEPLWEETPIVETSLPEGAILYAGRIPKTKRPSYRNPSARY